MFLLRKKTQRVLFLSLCLSLSFSRLTRCTAGTQQTDTTFSLRYCRPVPSERDMHIRVEMVHLDGKEGKLSWTQRADRRLRVSGGFRRHFAGCSSLSGIGSAAKKIDVEFRFEKALIGVLLHQTLDASLSSIEGFQGWIINVSNRGHTCLGVKIHLKGWDRGEYLSS